MAKETFRFIHCADLHLDSPFRGLGRTNERLAEHLRKATRRAFSNVVDACIKHEVAFLLVAGDVFDSADRSLGAQLFFRDELAKLAEHGICSYIVHGNHDPLDGWVAHLEWPDKVTIFSGPPAQRQVVAGDGGDLAVLWGVSYPTREVRKSLLPGFGQKREQLFHIGLLHCNVGSDTGHEPYAPCTMDELLRTGMDYWALGHVHRPGVLHEPAPVVCYSGTTQGRSIAEPSEHGCYLVEVHESGMAHAQFLPTDLIRFAQDTIAVNEDDSLDSVRDRLHERCAEMLASNAGRSLIVRLRLEGHSSVSPDINRPGAEQDLLTELRETFAEGEPFLWVDRLAVSVLPPIDFEARKKAEDFIGELLRLADTICEDPSELENLQSLLRQVYQHSSAPQSLKLPEPDEVKALIKQAARQCVERLIGEMVE
ncbi:MAG TPA: DNA repair exonuclease [Armatimonadetes bacterium]|nr:DNA repair exonuclease [Armatimonadota bacterium]